MKPRKHLLRILYVLVLIALYVLVDQLELPHFFKSGITGGLGASAAAWLLRDRTEKRNGDRGVEPRETTARSELPDR